MLLSGDSVVSEDTSVVGTCSGFLPVPTPSWRKTNTSTPIVSTRPRRRRKRIPSPQWLHLGHLAIFQLVDRVEEEDDPCLVPFHLSNGSNIGLALAVGQVLKHISM